MDKNANKRLNDLEPIREVFRDCLKESYGTNRESWIVKRIRSLLLL